MAKKKSSPKKSAEDRAVEELLRAKRSGTKLEQLAESLFEAFGGPDEIARLVHLSYMNSKDGSMTQIRVIDTLLKLVMAHDSRHGKSQEEELDDMTDLQLQAVMRDAAKYYGGSDNGDDRRDPESLEQEAVVPSDAAPAAEQRSGDEEEGNSAEGSGDSPGEEATGVA